MQKLITLSFILTTLTSIAQVNFTEATDINLAGINAGDLEFADIDGDNDLDIMVIGQKSNFSFVASMYTNDGDGNYTLLPDTPFEPMIYSSMAFADVDNDSDMDLMLSGQTVNDIVTQLYLNDGDGNFSLSSNSFSPLLHSDISFADVDGDGDQDFLITGLLASFTGSVAELYLNDGAGNFSLVDNTPFHEVYQGANEFADIDGDGDQDVLITGTFGLDISGNAWLYTNDGDGNFTEVNNTPFIGTLIGSVDFADIDNDSDLDVLITGDSPGLTSNLYKNDGTGIFTLVNNPGITDIIFSDCKFADVDFDQDLDLLIAGRKGPIPDETAELYLNDGSGQFSKANNFTLLGATDGSVDIGDVNGDGSPDLLVAGLAPDAGSYSKIYLNDLVSGIIEEKEEISIKILPNPFSEFINIKTEEPTQDLQFQLFDASGKAIPINTPVGNDMMIPTGHLPSGFYFLQISRGEKIIKNFKVTRQ